MLREKIKNKALGKNATGKEKGKKVKTDHKQGKIIKKASFLVIIAKHFCVRWEKKQISMVVRENVFLGV